MSATSADLGRPVTPLAIIAARLERLGERLGADGADPEVLAELRQVCELAGGLEPYLSRFTTPESPALRRLAERTRSEDWGRRPGVPLEREMLSGHAEGQALKLLVHVTRARRVLEIGMFTGYSALAMAEALPDDGVLVACEIDAYAAEFARRSFDEAPAGHKITVRVGPALATLAALAAAGEAFDLVFLDADKPGYVDYLNALLDDGLLAPHGLLCVDNTLLQGQAYLPDGATENGVAIAAFNRAVADDPGLAQVLLPLRDGLTLIRKC